MGDALCQGNDAQAIPTFKATLHPVLQKNCYQCHNSVTPQAPSPFADDSPSTAFANAKNFVDFNSPVNSTFVRRMDQGHNCGSNCAQIGNDFITQINAWRAQLGDDASGIVSRCNGKDKDDAKVILTKKIHIDQNLTTKPVAIKFDLSEANPPMPNAVFQFNVLNSLDPSTFMMTKPILAVGPQANPDQNVRVANIHILLNDKEDQSYRNWVSTDFIVQPKKFSKDVSLSGWFPVNESPQLIPWPTGPDKDHPPGIDITISVRVSVTNLLWTIPQNDPFRCLDLAKFTTYYTNNISTNTGKTPNCIGCHSNGGQGTPYFNMTGANAETCKQFKMRADMINVDKSLFILMPLHLVPNRTMPGPIIPLKPNELTELQAWIDAENQ